MKESAPIEADKNRVADEVLASQFRNHGLSDGLRGCREVAMFGRCLDFDEETKIFPQRTYGGNHLRKQRDVLAVARMLHTMRPRIERARPDAADVKACEFVEGEVTDERLPPAQPAAVGAAAQLRRLTIIEAVAD